MSKKARVHIVSQTHWDREWYLPFEQFRIRLVRLVDNLLDLMKREPRFRHFTLDGQTVVLEDYLEIRPEREEELKQLIKQGRMIVGPWYVMPDEFIVSGESIVRNLLIGRRIARQFGKVSSGGYVPDPFGHLAQLPQIFRGFGLDNFFFMRGMFPAERTGSEFRWQAPDGKSEVYAIWQQNGYGNASLLGYPFNWGDTSKAKFDMQLAMARIQKETQSLAKLNRCGAFLFNNGADHMEAQPELPEIIQTANRTFPDYDLRHSTLEKFAEEVRQAHDRLKIVRGELRFGRYSDILSGVLSSRMYLKMYNRRCEYLLERWAEPTSVLAHRLGGLDQSVFLNQAWKYVLQNHPHDSICGCSVDAVHREVISRYEKAGQIAESLITTNLRHIAAQVNTSREGAQSAVLVWNSLPTPRKGSLNARLLYRGELPQRWSFLNGAGKEVPVQVSSVRLSPRWDFDHVEPFHEIDLTLDLSTQGIGYQTLWLHPEGAKSGASSEWAKKATPKQIETDHYQIRFRSNGTFDLYDRKTRRTLKNQLLFEDTEDVGDEYDYSPAPKGKTLTTEKVRARIRIIERGPLFVTYEITHAWRLPVAAEDSLQARKKATRPFPIKTRMRVYQKDRRIEFVTEINNQVKDHRLRVHFPGPKGATQSETDGHFGIIPHPIEVESHPKNIQPNPTTFHMRFFTSLNDGKAGIALLNRGLLEYEIVRRPSGDPAIALTLLRSVGQLARGNLMTRKNLVGPPLPTPEAQCLGPCTFEYALLPFKGDDLAQDVTPEAESYATPVMLTHEPLHGGKLPPNKCFLSVDNPAVVWSAWKPAEKGQGSVLRFYNPAGAKQKIQVELAEPFNMVSYCDLKEDPVQDSKLQGERQETISLGKYEIKSLRLK